MVALLYDIIAMLKKMREKIEYISEQIDIINSKIDK